MNRKTPREGDIHEVVCVGGHSFTIRYGYYAEEERHNTDPLPIYPCFVTNPYYTEEGYPLVTRIQDACEHYRTEADSDGDGWCADCVHCAGNHDAIGICQCEHRQKQKTTV
ncbi:MAG: hypothetical protein IKA47_00950 [Oscillospiraceae bacterium]|nr:hypothetical protein [Oscillospiraceae bacterium]